MKKTIVTLVSLLPGITFGASITDADSLVATLTRLGNVATTILIALAVIFIIWHTVQFVMNASNEEERSKNRTGILWGIVGLAIILSIWGLVAILTNTFNTGNRQPTEKFPTIPVPPPVR
jgi:fumarate reductase subunit D